MVGVELVMEPRLVVAQVHQQPEGAYVLPVAQNMYGQNTFLGQQLHEHDNVPCGGVRNERVRALAHLADQNVHDSIHHDAVAAGVGDVRECDI